MKEIFAHNNYTLQDVARTSFESAWAKSTAGNQNKKSKKSTQTTLRQGAMSGSGYAYPGLSSLVQTSDQSEDQE